MAKLASACLATLSAETVRVQLPSAPQQSPECGVDTDTDYWVGVSSHVIRRRRHVTGIASSSLDSLYSVKLQKDTEPKSKVYENISLFILWLE